MADSPVYKKLTVGGEGGNRKSERVVVERVGN